VLGGTAEATLLICKQEGKQQKDGQIKVNVY